MSKYIIQKAIDPKDMTAKAKAVMAGKTYDLQPKYDGCHMIVVITPTSTGTTYDCYSATGEPVKSCDHIAEALQQVLEVDRPMAVCGEVWKPDTRFADISGAFRRQYPQPDLVFCPFDIVQVKGYNLGLPILEDARPYVDRIHALHDSRFEHPSIVRFNGHIPDDIQRDAPAYAQRLKDKGGYDGAIMHDLGAPYSAGRCRNAEVVKVKPLIELDLLVLDVELARGEKTGKRTASLVVKLADGKRGNVATGLTQKDIDAFHDWTSDLCKLQLSGKMIVAVEAMGWTDDGLLREPRFKGFRHDKVEADY